MSHSDTPRSPLGSTASRVIPLYVAEAKVYPRSVSGRFANWRWLMVALTQLFFYGVPWLQWNERQALLFDLDAGRFYVLGLLLVPQDFIYLAALLVLSALALFFFTAVAGRLWCGYSCPQTVYTEMFLWIERHTEGDRQARMRLDRGGFIQAMHQRGIGTGVHYPAMHLFRIFRELGYNPGDFPQAERIGAATVTLPLFPGMADEDVDRVCTTVAEVLSGQ